MKQIVMIEPDVKHLQTFKSVLEELGNGTQVIHFATLTAFQESLKASDPAAASEGSGEAKGSSSLMKSEIGLVVADIDAIQGLPLENWRDLIQTLGPPLSQDEKVQTAPTRLILTGHENDGKNVDFSQYIRPHVFALLVKPFDRLLLKQYIQLASALNDSLATDGIYTQQIEAPIELIKDIEITALSEMGFRTRSNRPISVGKVARYFGHAFGSSAVQSLFAFCSGCVPVAGQTDEYDCSFSFFGIPRERLSEIRVLISKSPKKDAILFPSPEKKPVPPVALVLTRDEAVLKSFKSLVEEKTTDLKVISIASLSDLQKSLPPTGLATPKNPPKTYIGSFAEVILTFDAKGTRLLKCMEKLQKGASPMSTAFGEKVESLVARENPLALYLTADDQKRLKTLLTTRKIEPDLVLTFKLSADISTQVKVVSVTAAKDGALGPVLNVILKELSANDLYEIAQGQGAVLSNVHFVLIDRNFSTPESMGAVKEMVKVINGEKANPAKFICVTNAPVTLYSQIQELAEFDDVFSTPFDIFYVSRKLKLHDSDLVVKNVQDNFCMGAPVQGSIKTGLPATLKAISEIHISIQYARAIEVGQSRRFVLGIQNDRQLPEILAVCRHVEELEKGLFLCEFLFFGVGDQELKNLRQWIKENYVHAKLKESEN